MSYCTEVKNELSELKNSKCCKYAYAYGFMLFGRAFSAKKISMQTGNGVSAGAYSDTLIKIFGVETEMKVGGSVRPTYRVCVPSEGDRLKILATYDFGMSQDVVNTDFLERECCSAAFLRGVFMACGNISDPDREYRLDFAVNKSGLANDLSVFLNEKGFAFKCAARGKAFVLYTKDSAVIEDFLTFIGAASRTLEMINTKILKSVKNKINRNTNCDSANITKTVEASIKQRRAIDYLEKIGRLESLPKELIVAANLRKENPNATLKELCRISGDGLTVSGLNHRLKKIIEEYDSVKK